MKHILVFGDSNTWGYVPGSEGERWPYEQRLCGVMQAELGADYRVIEEGLNGRTTVFKDPMMDDRCGKNHLSMLLESHAPLDLVVIMLGTNDLKHFLHLSADDIALGAATLAEIVMADESGPGGGAAQVLLVAPPAISDDDAFAPKFVGSEQKSQDFPRAYANMAEQIGCGFFDAAPVSTVPVPDGVHLDAPSAQRLGNALAAKAVEMLSREAHGA